MATDRTEQQRRGQHPAKTPTKHPYAAIEHRVIDSDAYADLSFSARSLLIQLTRQLTKPNNNGRLQAAHSYLTRYGFSDNTVTRAIAELVDHGFVFRTRSGGFHLGAAQFAVTWLPLTDKRDGLSCNGFKPFAWREWKPSPKKTRPPKVRTYSRKFGEWTAPTAANLGTVPPPKSTDIELMPCIGRNSGHQTRLSSGRKPQTSPLAIRLSTTADRGHLRLVA